MKVSFQVGPRNDDHIELARKALNNGTSTELLKIYLCQFMTYSQLADALFYLTGENQELLDKTDGVFEAIVEKLQHIYTQQHKKWVYDF